MDIIIVDDRFAELPRLLSNIILRFPLVQMVLLFNNLGQRPGNEAQERKTSNSQPREEEVRGIYYANYRKKNRKCRWVP